MEVIDLKERLLVVLAEWLHQADLPGQFKTDLFRFDDSIRHQMFFEDSRIPVYNFLHILHETSS